MKRATILTLLVVLGGVVAAVGPAIAVQAGDLPSSTDHPTVSTDAATVVSGNDTSNNTSQKSSLGASISAFMQSNAERTDEAVSQGMWSAAFHRSEGGTREKLATSHVKQLNETLASLERDRQQLLDAYRAGEISKLTFQARMSALVERYRALRDSVSATATAMNASNVHARGIDDLERSVGSSSVQANGNGAHGPPWLDGTNVSLPFLEDGNGEHPQVGAESNRTGTENGNDHGGTPPGHGDAKAGDGGSSSASTNTSSDGETTNTSSDNQTSDGGDQESDSLGQAAVSGTASLRGPSASGPSLAATAEQTRF